MSAFGALLATRNEQRVDIPVIGDSLVSGLFASEYSNIWVQQLNQLARAAYPTTANGSGGGLGWIPVNDIGATANVFGSGWPVVDTTGAGPADLGPIRGADLILGGGGSISFTGPAGTTSAQPTYFDATPAGSMAVAKNGVTQYTITNAGTLVDIKAPSVPMADGDVLTITYVSGVCGPTGILHFAGDENSGITFHAMGRAGWTSGTQSGIGWNVPEDEGPGLNWAQGAANSVSNAVGLIIMLGGNDGSVAIGDRTAPQYQSDLAALGATYRADSPQLATAPFLYVGEYEGQFRPWADSGGWPAYYPATAAVAAADVNATAFNLATAMIGGQLALPSAYTIPFPSQYYAGGGGHPNDAGELIIAEAVFSQMAPARARGWSLPLFTGGL